ncbi:MAG: hypothetical protein US68_C0032G0007 [Candidatus Shapirobacteria bacterium GW2011_GWE1_38_10]|uniref:Big-1 domain-containing protein n=1 Tax=Candidatus Shapirobacteria bacterium GW2011_GWE1_38_10 TaxID=1618488 RepID=A0A0G0L706_9BACT|nr:MAG: hypothetical protein US68_C0032G0007 [Candidatus Shapirobacteria bacterium GW2011_GWE1_38_10]
MGVDPFVQYNIVSSNREAGGEEKQAKRRPYLTIILIIILLLFLVLSVFLLSTRTSFFNFASELAGPTPISTTSTIVDTATSSATNVETNTTSTTIPIPRNTGGPISTPSSIAIDNSYMFASPLKAATGNVEKIRITVFILDGTGSGVSGKVINLTGINSLAVYSIQPTTDTTGRAIFDVAAGTSGTYEIGAMVGALTLSQKVTVTFD